MYIVYTYNFAWHFGKDFPSHVFTLYIAVLQGENDILSAAHGSKPRPAAHVISVAAHVVLLISQRRYSRSPWRRVTEQNTIFLGGRGKKKPALFWGTLGEKGIQSFDYTGYLVFQPVSRSGAILDL